MVSHVFVSQKLKKLQEAESLPFCPTVAAFFLHYENKFTKFMYVIEIEIHWELMEYSTPLPLKKIVSGIKLEILNPLST